MSDPMNFPLIVSFMNILVELRDVVEVCQGGPVIGKLFINKKAVHCELWFGGPIYIYEDNLFLTKRQKSFLFNGFKLCKINLLSGEIFEFNIKDDLIWITEVSPGKLTYKTSIDSSGQDNTLLI